MTKREWVSVTCLLILGWSLLEMVYGGGEGWLLPAVMAVAGLMVVL